MIRALLSELGVNKALRRALFWLTVVFTIIAVAFVVVARERKDAADDVRRALEAQQSREVKDAIIRSAPGPRPSGSEFVDCLRRAGPGCL